jgi:hypothetical protein
MKKVIWLRIYRGNEILKRENGTIKNENSKVALTHNTLEWKLYLEHLRANPFCKVVVEKVLEQKDGKYVELEIPKSIEDEVRIAHLGDQTVKLTPEQKRIAELEAKLDALLSLKLVDGDKKEDIKVVDEDLEDLKSKYKEQEGKEVPNNKKNDKEWIKNKLK